MYAQKIMNNYDKVLDLCKSDKDEVRVHFWEPFSIGNYAYASNGSILCRIPLELCSLDLEAPTDESFANSVVEIKIESEQYNSIDKSIFLEKMKNWPTIESNGTKTCDACNGECQVDYTFRHGRQCFEIESECPVCKGEGEVEDENAPKGLRPDESLYVKISDIYHFEHRTLSILHKTIELFPESDINYYLDNAPIWAQRFKIDKIQFVVMPVYDTSKMEKYFEI